MHMQISGKKSLVIAGIILILRIGLGLELGLGLGLGF